MTLNEILQIPVALPLLIFCARVVDVTLGTMRIIFISRGRRNIAPLLGFVEVFIWIAIVAQIVSRANTLTAYLAYAAGFAAGNFVGMLVESRLAFGEFIVRTIVPDGGEELAQALHSAGFGVTTFNGQGALGPVTLVFTIVKRKDVSIVQQIIHQKAPRAFISVEDVFSTEAGIFPPSRLSDQGVLLRRKTK